MSANRGIANASAVPRAAGVGNFVNDWFADEALADPPCETLHIPDMIFDLFWGVRGLAIIIVAVVALSAMARGHQPHFVPRPTGPMPAVNVP